MTIPKDDDSHSLFQTWLPYAFCNNETKRPVLTVLGTCKWTSGRNVSLYPSKVPRKFPGYSLNVAFANVAVLVNGSYVGVQQYLNDTITDPLGLHFSKEYET